MAPTSSPPRDHTADADTELSRKRARLSEDSTTESSSPVEELRIEALSPDLVEEDLVSTIELEDVEEMTETPYSHSFGAEAGRDALTEVRNVLAMVQSTTHYLDGIHLVNLAESLKRHLNLTQDHGESTWLRMYTAEDTFFGDLATLLLELLGRADFLDERVVREDHDLLQAIPALLHASAMLSTRFVTLLPAITTEKLSRRDSTQMRSNPQQIVLLRWTRILSAVICDNALFFRHISACYSIKTKHIAEAHKSEMLARGGTMSSFVLILRNVSYNAREISDAWSAIDSIIRIMGATAASVGDAATELIQIVNDCILPAICEKHSKALPEGFHECVTVSTATILQQRAGLLDLAGATELYEQLVKSADDALLPEIAASESTSLVLWRTSSDDQNILADLLRAAWILQAFKAFMFSEIMDVRSCGVNMLSLQLTQWHESHVKYSLECDHPVVQYAARFLRANEFTKYIFSADSHASIVSHCEEIINFLAQTGAYSDQEGDIIWHACTTSVEADFVKASFNVLERICKSINFDHLLHLLKKFTTTDLSSVNEVAVHMLGNLYVSLHETTLIHAERVSNTQIALISLDIARNLAHHDTTPVVQRLMDIVMKEIARVVQRGGTECLQICEQCVPDIVNHTEYATLSTQVLTVFLTNHPKPKTAQLLLAMLPLESAVGELELYTQHITRAEIHGFRGTFIAVASRIEVITRLMSLPDAQYDASLESRLFECAIGENAPENETRNAAWSKLATLAHSRDSPPAARRLLDRYLVDQVPKLPARFATLALVFSATQMIQAQVLADPEDGRLSRMLEMSLWHVLVRAAAQADDGAIIHSATEAICKLLFALPQQFRDKDVAVRCQAQFVREYLRQLCIDHHHLQTTTGSETDHRWFQQSLGLLTAVIQQSKETRPMYQLASQMGTLRLCHDEDLNDTFSFSVHIHMPENQQKTINVRANTSTTVGDLANALPSETGAAENRMIFGGRQIDLKSDTDTALSDAGVHASAALLISPKYTSECDLDKILTRLDPVEEALLAQYDQLETFLDSSPLVAEATYRFLCMLRPSATARYRVVSSSKTAVELFPADRLCRSFHTIDILSAHLKDLSQMGVADARLIHRGAHLLTDVVLDEARPFAPFLLVRVLLCLAAYIRGMTPASTLPSAPNADMEPERPTDDSSTKYFDSPEIFSSRMTEILSAATRLPRDSAQLVGINQTRTCLVHAVYSTLSEAFKADARVWTGFTEIDDSRLQDLHTGLLLHEDLVFSRAVASVIQNLCHDPAAPVGCSDFYWRIAVAIIPQAMQNHSTSIAFFDLASDLVNNNSALQADEKGIRDLVEQLVSLLWAHKHTETADSQQVDDALAGLLKLLISAILVLKSFKKPLGQVGLSNDLFERLLFPAKDSTYQPLLLEITRSHVYKLLRLTCQSAAEYADIIRVATVALGTLPMDSPTSRYPGRDEWLRPAMRCAGLVNLGMTCYMNSLLQQLFANLPFRKFVLDTKVVDREKQIFLTEVQDLFGRMQEGATPCEDTSALAKVLGIQTDSQEDVHGFYATFISGLEDNMPDAESKRALATFFTGKFISQIKGDCGHVSTQTEPFTDISITVKNKASLRESLEEYVQGEPMQGSNKYRCMTCDPDGGGRLVDAMKRTCLDEIPDTLTFCLKRFTFEAMMGLEGKVNDRFDFPAQIDMSNYKREYLEDRSTPPVPDLYELTGVIVHQGSLEFGHYWSYVRLAGSGDASTATWVCLEDKNVKVCASIEEVQLQCFGGARHVNGHERADNAYVLLYQRQEALKKQGAIMRPMGIPYSQQMMMPPRVDLPAALAQTMLNSSMWRHRVSHLFEPQLSSLICWLLDTLPPKEGAATSESSTNDDAKSDTSTSISEGEDIGTDLASLASEYLMRVVLTDLTYETKLKPILNALKARVGTSRGALASTILQRVCALPVAFGNIWRLTDAVARIQVSTFVLRCVAALRDCPSVDDKDLVRRIVDVHASLLPYLATIHCAWSEYFNFIAVIASFGLWETILVLDSGYLLTALEVIGLAHTGDMSRRKHLAIWNLMKSGKIEFGSAFEFLSAILSEHVELEFVNSESTDEVHQVSNGLARLNSRETNLLALDVTVEKHKLWGMIYIGSQRCSPTADWASYAPGKLVGLLSGLDNLQVLHFIEDTLSARYHDESERIEPLLAMTLHYCNVRRDQLRTSRLLERLAQEIPAWENAWMDILRFSDAAIALAPIAVLDNLLWWTADYLSNKLARVRRGTAQWLENNLFVDAQTDHALVVPRLRAIRKLAATCLDATYRAYHHEMSKAPFLEQLSVLESANTWLITLQQAVQGLVSANQGSSRSSLGPELQAEHDEARSTLRDLQQRLPRLREWESDGITYSNGADVRRSVEVQDSDPEDGLGSSEDEEAYTDDPDFYEQ